MALFYLKFFVMKKITLFFLLLSAALGFAQQQTVTYSIAPPAFEEGTSITVTINGSSVNEATWAVTGNALYMWAWSFDINDSNIQDCPTNGTWTNSNEANKFTYNAGTDTYTKTFVPTTFYNRVGIGRIGFLVKAKNATGDKKSQDILVEVGAFQVNVVTPAQNSTTILPSGSNLLITANNTNGNASYNLKSNGVSIDTNGSTSSYSFNHTNITGNQNYELETTQGPTTITKKFTVIVNPGTVSEALPANRFEGINYDPADASKATLVLDAPEKDFVYVAGSFNNWQPTAAYAMKKDTAPNSTKFWLELTGLTPGQNYTYQYWVVDSSPIANSPALVKTADPYSTLVLSPFDDGNISPTTYPDLPAYPTGQEREVTVLQTAQTPYNWQVPNFTKPSKDNLVVYEVLVRDFDSDRSYQDLIDKIDYFKNLKVNAIELMPVMEYEGSESWGYNTVFHLANDKFYGPANKLKEFIDLCHQNGIAVILDVALNHAFGRNPMVRMWMNDPDGDGWGDPSTESPYFNTQAMHSYSVGSDFNHTQERTQTYVKRVIRHWIEEYNIDGFRWDLTKGFTQQCPSNVAGGQEACTGGYRSDRVAILKEYADYSWFGDNSATPNAWNGDPNHYVIFEHLGQDNEEQEWANYRINETPSKGVMMWGIMNSQYNQLSMGYNSGNDITRMGNGAHGFTKKRVMGYAESHDEERLMYRNIVNGNSSNASHNVKTLNTALSRMSAIGAISLLVPGPKMIWHFGALGYDSSIYTCNNGTVNTPSDPTAGDCKLDTKPQPQWTNNWLGNTNRAQIYNDWAKFINWKKNVTVFQKDYAINSGTTLTPKLYLYDSANSIPATDTQNVVILTNFNVTSQAVVANFPYQGLWYNLMDETSFNVTNTAMTITIQPGQFKIFGNKLPTLSNDELELVSKIHLSPNPASNYFTLDLATTNVQIFSITGQLVKNFKSNFTNESQFDISDLNKGIYIVKATDDTNREATMKLIKQ